MRAITERKILNHKSLFIVSLVSLSLFSQTLQKEIPQYFQEHIAQQKSVSIEKENFKDYDFSKILADEHTDFIGYIGKDYQRLYIKFDDVKRNSEFEYLVSGSSIVKGRSLKFQGKMQVIDIKKFINLDYGADDFMLGKVKEQGLMLAKYLFTEDEKRPASGLFEGYALVKWYKDAQNKPLYDDIDEDSDSYANNQFLGTWKSYKAKISKPCSWGHYRIPQSGDLDIGAAEFSPNSKYFKNGWGEF